ncbi:signal transduction histidine kinase [Oxalobacteraceae bacterium GrIS 2.11]
MPKLLCVDDQPINIQILYQIFGEDHDILVATNGHDALALCDNSPPDLILLDIMMPGMSGHEVCRRLKQDSRTANIPIIFVTAQNNIEEETAGLQEGAVDFISRPFNAAVVRARVQTHIQLYQLKESLEEKVKMRNQELELALQRLHDSQEQLTISEAKATISTLIASVSHELSSPIGNSLMASSSLYEFASEFKNKFDSGSIRRSDVPVFLAELNEASSLIERNLKRASVLLANLRQVSADQASEQRRTFDLADTVKEVIDTIRPSLKRKPHRIIQDIPSNILMDSRPGALGQVVINLINNAFLHAFEDRNDGVLGIEGNIEGGEVQLRFRDNGVGIPQEHLSKIYEPFFSTKIGEGGSGLGMAIVHNLVTKTLGGSIKIHSTVGNGSEFVIRLPLVIPFKKTL